MRERVPRDVSKRWSLGEPSLAHPRSCRTQQHPTRPCIIWYQSIQVDGGCAIAAMKGVEADGRERGVEAQIAERGSVDAGGPLTRRSPTRGSEDGCSPSETRGTRSHPTTMETGESWSCNRAETDPRVGRRIVEARTRSITIDEEDSASDANHGLHHEL